MPRPFSVCGDEGKAVRASPEGPLSAMKPREDGAPKLNLGHPVRGVSAVDESWYRSAHSPFYG
jgi:hypothetical protein